MELGVPLTPDYVFEIASNTKQFTATAVLLLTEQGKVSLQDPITRFIPDYPTGGNTITIEHLLTHTSGIPDYLSSEDFDQSVWRRDHTPSEFIDLFIDEELDFEPGTEYRYSNSGYYLLGYIIEKASGMSYQEYLEKSIFEPAEMENTYYNDYNRIITKRSKGYMKGPEGFENAEYVSPSVLYSAGALVSTVGDFNRYYQALNTYKIVTRENLEKARTGYHLLNGEDTGYGYGVQPRVFNGYRTIAHAGGGPGYWSMHWYFPDSDIHFIIFTNCENHIDKDGLIFKLALLVADDEPSH